MMRKQNVKDELRDNRGFVDCLCRTGGILQIQQFPPGAGLLFSKKGVYGIVPPEGIQEPPC